jgi:hypothetical protein
MEHQGYTHALLYIFCEALGKDVWYFSVSFPGTNINNKKTQSKEIWNTKNTNMFYYIYFLRLFAYLGSHFHTTSCFKL